MINLGSSIIAQYANSPILMSWISSIDSEIDPSVNLTSLKTNVWGAVSTATPESGGGVTFRYGLDMWGRIVGVNRNLIIPASVTNRFGFAEAAPSWTGFWDGASGIHPPYEFWDNTYTTQTSAVLSNTQMQQMILAKAYANISSCSSYALNIVVRKMFGPRVCVYDNGGMSMTVNFESAPSTDTNNLIIYGNVLPHSSGVLVSITTSVIH